MVGRALVASLMPIRRMPAMYDPRTLARYYASRAQSYSSLADESSSIARTIYLRLAEIFNELGISADRFAAELRGEAKLELRKEEPGPAAIAPPPRSKRRRASRKQPLAPSQLTDAAVAAEARH
jgi:hypothetical protein